MKKDPIFIHSLFRTGSTYVFNVFRRSTLGYWCYQEPLHEIAVFARDDVNLLLLDQGEEKVQQLRHPRIEKAYFKELYETWPVWKNKLSEAAVYNGYFSPPEADIGISYWQTLIEAAQGRPVFQECRTSGRIEAIKEIIGGHHLYLWRNPWDQWWSHKVDPYFDIANQLIINAPNPPSVVQVLRAELNHIAYKDNDLCGAFEHYRARPLNSDGSYLVFYLLWYLGLQAGLQHADLLINVDRLSTSSAYRSEIVTGLEKFSILEIDFSDCNIPQCYFHEDEKNHFRKLEERVHGLLKNAGWSQDDLNRVNSLRDRLKPKSLVKQIDEFDKRDLAQQISRFSFLARRMENDLAERQHQGLVQLRALEDKVLHAETVLKGAETRIQQAEHRALQAEKRAHHAEIKSKKAEADMKSARRYAANKKTLAELAETEAEASKVRLHVAETKAAKAEATLTAISNSRIWRITAPWRWAGEACKWFSHAIHAWITLAPGSRPRRILSSLIILTKASILKHQWLKILVVKFLTFFPKLEAHIRLIGASYKSPSSLPSGSNGDCHIIIDDLSRSAQSIYYDLKAAINERELKEQR